MKKIVKLIWATIVAAGLAGVVFVYTGCQKDETKITKSATISQEDLELSNKIKSFIGKMTKPSMLKNDGLMDADDALWSLEAAMNYSFADIPEIFGDTKMDTLKFTLSIGNDGFCKESSFSALYQSVDNAIQTYCNALDEYQLLGVDINMNEKVNDTVTVYLISGKGVSSSMFTFGSTDYWKSGWGYGKCGPYEGQSVGYDAATEIQRKANTSIPHIEVQNGTIYYTDISEYTVWCGCEFNYINPNFQYDDDPLTSQLFYCSQSVYPALPWGTRCLEPDILNFYLTNLKHYANNVWKPAGKRLMSYTWKSSYFVGKEQNSTISDEFHWGSVKYGVSHVKPGGPVTQ